MRKVHELKRSGATIIYVTHSASDVRAIGDRCLWLDAGQVRECGDPESVVSHYLAEMLNRDTRYLDAVAPAPSFSQSASTAEPPELIHGVPNVDHRWGNGNATILGVALTTPSGRAVSTMQPNQPVVLRVSARANRALARPIVGFVMRNHLGIDFAVSNTLREGFPLHSMQPGTTITVDFHLTIPQLYPSSFAFSAAIADGTLDAYAMCDFIDNALSVSMDASLQPIYGYIHLPCEVGVNQRLGQDTYHEALHG
ncbi:MAG: Wzt carbohydrate-binding domain-containing protein [Bryobacterales bacterium]|jgi:hypothetical protein|nr:Wzt carbohydrate-binding domain-containing protein [Bryobacterales bacterium]